MSVGGLGLCKITNNQKRNSINVLISVRKLLLFNVLFWVHPILRLTRMLCQCLCGIASNKKPTPMRNLDSSTGVFQQCFRWAWRWNFCSPVRNPRSGDKLLLGPVHDRVRKQRVMDENFPPRSLLTASLPLFPSHSSLPRTDDKAEKRPATCDRSLLGSEPDLSNTAAFFFFLAAHANRAAPNNTHTRGSAAVVGLSFFFLYRRIMEMVEG